MSRFQRPGGAKPANPSPAPQPVSRYKGAGNIQIGVEANYLRPGRYLAMIERVETGLTGQGKEPFTAVKLVILAADDTGLSPLDKQFGRGLHRLGEEVSWFSKETGKGALYFEQNMLKFAIVAWNLTQEEIDAAEKEEQVRTPGFSFIDEIKTGVGLAGVVVEVEATMRQNADARKANAAPDAKNVNTFPKWIRRLPYSEVKEVIDPALLAQNLPDLEAKIAAEAQTS